MQANPSTHHRSYSSRCWPSWPSLTVLVAGALGVTACAGPDSDPGGGPALPPQCAVAADCDALLVSSALVAACTDVSCVDGNCRFDGSDHAGDPCDDADPCTESDHCQNRLCVGTPVVCDDADSCTKDACEPASGVCTFTLRQGGACDDGVGCTADDVCRADGVCAGEATEACQCSVDADCLLRMTPEPCAGVYVCGAAYTCELDATQALQCPEGACFVGACDPTAGKCVNTPAHEGEACVPESSCVVNAVCLGGSCQGELMPCDDGNPCTAGHCEAGACVFVPLEGEPCDDGDPCTEGEACTAAGACVGQGLTCDDGNVCTADACVSKDGGCVYEPLSEGGCDDKDPCTVADACAAGICVGSPMDCSDTNPCTTGLCKVVSGTAECLQQPAPGACDDGNPCTVDDFCQGGLCQPGLFNQCPCEVDAECAPLEDGDLCNGTLVCDTETMPYQCVVDPATVVVCPEPDEPCRHHTCVPATGDCVLALNPAESPCDDGDACTQEGYCSDAVCVSTPIACEDGDPCTADLCSDGVCGEQTLDGGAVFLTEGFDGGLPDGWTLESDNPDVGWAVGAAGAAAEGGQGLYLTGPDATYDHGATTATVRSPPLAIYGASPTLSLFVLADLGDQGCLADVLQVRVEAYGSSTKVASVCDSTAEFAEVVLDLAAFRNQTISLALTFLANATANGGFGVAVDDVLVAADFDCDDGDPCTLDDRCVAGTCTGQPKPCDDGDLCTGDACDPVSGACVHGDLEACACFTEADCVTDSPCILMACGESGFCQESLLDGPCDDGDACTEGDTCAGGLCTGTDVVCPDQGPCTDEACDPAVGCVATPNEASCDDGDPCTVDDQCSEGICAGQPMACQFVCATGHCVEGECTPGDVLFDGAKVVEQKFDGTAPGTLPSGWTSTAEGGAGLWETSTTSAKTLPNAAWASLPAGEPTTVVLSSPEFTLPPAGGKLVFWVAATMADESCAADYLTVAAGGATVATLCASTVGWEQREVDLAIWGGQTITASFALAASGAAGVDVRLDSVRVSASYPCNDPCYDGGICFGGVCIGGNGPIPDCP